MGLFARNSGIRVLGQVPLEILKRSRLRAGKYTFWVLPGREEMDKCHSRPEMVGPPSAWTDARGAGAGETDEGRKSGAALPLLVLRGSITETRKPEPGGTYGAGPGHTGCGSRGMRQGHLLRAPLLCKEVGCPRAPGEQGHRGQSTGPEPGAAVVPAKRTC